MQYFLVLAFVYLFASIPFGLLVSKYFYETDIRSKGSGNIGATNVLRNLGVFPAVLVLILDMGKGITAVFLARYFLGTDFSAVIAGLIAIIGHSCSCFLGFKGGKGVATGLGVILMLSPLVTCLTVMVFVLVVALTRYVSLGSVLGALLLPLLMIVFHQPKPYLYFACLAAAFVIYRHRGNIQRLLQGTESKIGSK
ncbi:MAG: glycerol-3-phosphate 1-O-acyltransferase PlsY [bacterium]